MARSNGAEIYPKSFEEAVRKVAFNAFMAAVLGIIIYMSVLFLFRTVANPTIIGYIEHVQQVDDKGNVVSEKRSEPYFFKDGEKPIVPKEDNTHYYNVLYTNDTFPEVLSLILMVSVSLIMIYNVAWGFGAYEHNTVGLGTTTRDKLRGVKVGLASSFMFGISYLLLILAKLGIPIKFALGFFGLVIGTYLPLYNAVISSKYGVFGLTAILNSNIESITIDNISFVGILVMLIPLIIKVLVCYIGYEFGFKQFSIREKLLYKK